MSDLRDRDRLYARFKEVLGPEPADILMSNLPPVRDVATSADVARVESRIGGLETRMDGLESRMERLEAHMERFDDRLHDFHGTLREQTRTFAITTLGGSATLAGAIVAAAAIL